MHRRFVNSAGGWRCLPWLLRCLARGRARCTWRLVGVRGACARSLVCGQHRPAGPVPDGHGFTLGVWSRPGSFSRAVDSAQRRRLISTSQRRLDEDHKQPCPERLPCAAATLGGPSGWSDGAGRVRCRWPGGLLRRTPRPPPARPQRRVRATGNSYRATDEIFVSAGLTASGMGGCSQQVTRDPQSPRRRSGPGRRRCRWPRPGSRPSLAGRAAAFLPAVQDPHHRTLRPRPAAASRAWRARGPADAAIAARPPRSAPAVPSRTRQRGRASTPCGVASGTGGRRGAIVRSRWALRPPPAPGR